MIPPAIQYPDRGLSQDELGQDPLEQFQTWLQAAVEDQVPEANAMCLCTVDLEGGADGRMVLLKGVTQSGVLFFSNYESRKAEQLARNPMASGVIWWEKLKRQVRISGRVEKAPRSDSDSYFQSRPRSSQLGAWASRQSRPLESRAQLEERLEDLTSIYKDQDIPRPDHWGGYILVPNRVEFWQGRTSRLHDRFVYLAQGDSWSVRRLMP